MLNTAKMQILKNHGRYTNVNLWISFFFILLMLLSTISFSCYPTICVKNTIGEMLFQFCLIEFYKEGKYDLDFKNPNSDPSKWVRTSSKFLLLETGTELAKSGFVLCVTTSLTPKNFFRSNFDFTLESRNNPGNLCTFFFYYIVEKHKLAVYCG